MEDVHKIEVDSFYGWHHMDTIKIYGGVSLQGKVRIQGSKNASLPILASALLTEGETILQNVPRISDVFHMVQILQSLGCRVRFFEKQIRVQPCFQKCTELPTEAVRGMRSSVYLMGALLGRGERIALDQPGGCVIGERPIDIHISALEQMGAVFEETDGRIEGYVPGKLRGADITLRFPSVGATENIILAGVLAKGRTCIYGAAREPEVCALCRYLNCCGAKIDGIGTEVLSIEGVMDLKGTYFYVPGDRIVAGTYMLMTAATGGCSFLEGIDPEQVESVTALLQRMDCECQTTENGIFVQAPKMLRAVGKIATGVYPGFPTDLQSVAMVTALKIPQCTCIEENIFENRFHIVSQLEKMGAYIRVENCRTARVNGGKVLSGCEVEAKELRGGAALITAGLIAGGLTSVTGCCYIDRGYENICKDLRELGARVYCDK